MMVLKMLFPENRRREGRDFVVGVSEVIFTGTQHFESKEYFETSLYM